MNIPLIKKPGAWFPVVISLLVLAIMLSSFSMFGFPAREPDEGTGAHLFQIWLVLELLAIAFFAMKWLPRDPKQALAVLALQVGTMLLPMGIVFFLKL